MEADAENNDTFLVSASSDKVVALKDFAFENQENFFQLPENFQIPLHIPNDQLLDIPLNTTFPRQHSKTFEDLSLIEEITEHSSMSTIKSRDVSPRDFDQNLDLDKNISPKQDSKIAKKGEKKCHKPKILQKTLSLDSPRNISSKMMNKICSDINLKLPSKSNPATPREDAEDTDKSKKPLFAQNKTKIVGKRYQRSPARDREARVEAAEASVPKPIQTKTGLVVTQPRPSAASVTSMGRSASSASLILGAALGPGLGLDRQLSKSSENIPGLIPRYKKQKYDHVQSKVKQYIEEMKKNKTNSSTADSKKSKSRSCSNLLKNTRRSGSDLTAASRPRTADATTLRLTVPGPGPERTPSPAQPAQLRKSISKSDTNLKRTNLSVTPSFLTKSSFTIGHMGAIYDSSEEEDLTQLTAIYRGEDQAGSLLDLVARERKSKQVELSTKFANFS